MIDETIEVNIASSNEVWQLYFDGTSRMDQNKKIICRVGVVLVPPWCYVLSYAYSSSEPCSENIANCNAFIFELQLLRK